MDNLDRLYERKKFFKIIFNGMDENEYIRVFQKNEEFNKVTFWNNIDDLNNYIESNRYNANTYFNLSTTDGEGGAVENLKYRYCIAFDFDKKLDSTLDAKDIMFRFKSIGLWYHALIDSGHGYHAYMVINKTNDINKVVEVTKAIGDKLGADTNAMLPTQVLRVPYTFNLKDEKVKQVNIIKLFEKATIKPYDINNLYKKYCNYNTSTGTERTIQYATNKTQFPPCILKILEGVSDGDRNFALKRLISFLKVFRYSKSEAWNIIKEWDNKNSPPIGKELEYQFNYIWDKSYYTGCNSSDAVSLAQLMRFCDKEECKYKAKGDILFVDGETIQIEYKLCTKIGKQRKGSFEMKGNHLLIIGILKNNINGLSTDEIITKLSYKGKCSISNKTLIKVLGELSDNGYITKIKGNKRKGEKDFYKMNDIKCEEIEKFNLSYFALLGVIRGDITTEDFKIYCYMRYRLSKGLSVIQEDLGKSLNIGQQAISKHINKLIKEKYIELVYVDYSINPLGVNIYRTNV